MKGIFKKLWNLYLMLAPGVILTGILLSPDHRAMLLRDIREMFDVVLSTDRK